MIYLILISQKKEITPVIAAGGALFSELTATAACMLALGLDFFQGKLQTSHRTASTYFTSIFLYEQRCSQKFTFCQKQYCHFHKCLLKEIAQIAVPHSVNRLLLTLLSGIEMVLIPQRLLLSGINQTDSLSVYGIFTGMALPLILFPATLTNSASVMLMPSVAGLQASVMKKKFGM